MNIDLRLGDCIEVLRTLPDNSVDSVVCDPPYHLTSIVKRFGKEGSAPAQFGTDGAFARASKGFMGKEWDGGDIAFRTDVWSECLRVLKPGGHLLAFGGSRTYHRLAVAVEDAGFEIRDQIMWIYSTGFPKSHNISKNLTKLADEYERTEQNTEHNLRCMSDSNIQKTQSIVEKQGEALFKSMSEQSLSQSRNPSNNVWREESILERGDNLQETKGELQRGEIHKMPERIYGDGEERWIHNGTQISDGKTSQQITNENGSSPSHRPQSIKQSNRKSNAFSEQLTPQEIREIATTFNNYGTALKPAHEPIVMARKPLSEKSIAENVLKWGTGGINIDGCRIEFQDEKIDLDKKLPIQDGGTIYGNGNGFYRTEEIAEYKEGGRFPANIMFDEEAGKLLDQQSGISKSTGAVRKKNTDTDPSSIDFKHKEGEMSNPYAGETGGASRFFYCPKVSKKERGEGNVHPTVKPIKLMEYLITLVTPKGGVVLDCFMGSGSTGIAARNKGFKFIGIEKEQEYMDIAKQRITSTYQTKLDI